MKVAAAPVVKSALRRNAPPERLSAARGDGFGPHISVQRDGDGASRDGASALVRSALSSPGRPLDTRTRAFMEPRFGYNLSAVRVHADETAARSADAIGAHAYTAGSHIVFGRGQFAPGAPSGQHTIAHELNHVIQQARGPVAGTAIGGGISVSHPGDQFERSAAAAADIAMSERSSAGDGTAPLAALPAASGSGEPVALQGDWTRAGGIAGIVGAALGGAALLVAIGAWAKPKNPNATGQGINMQPNPFNFSTLGDNAAAPSTAPDAGSKFQAAAEGPPRMDKILELRTDNDNEQTFNLHSNADGNNIITANVIPLEPKGYKGGYNGSIATVTFSETQTFPPPKGAPPAAPAQPAQAPQGQSSSTAGATAAQAASSSAASGGGPPAAAPAPQVARAVIHFSGTNGKSGERLQTYAGEILVTAEPTVRCTRCVSLNGIGHGVPGPYGLVDYQPMEMPRRGFSFGPGPLEPDLPEFPIKQGGP